MEREQAEKLLSALIFNDLDDASKAELLTYLETDDSLRERLTDMRMAAKVTTDAIKHEAAPVLSPERLGKLQELATGHGRRHRIILIRSLAAAAAIIVVGFITIGTFQMQGGQMPWEETRAYPVSSALDSAAPQIKAHRPSRPKESPEPTFENIQFAPMPSYATTHPVKKEAEKALALSSPVANQKSYGTVTYNTDQLTIQPDPQTQWFDATSAPSDFSVSDSYLSTVQPFTPSLSPVPPEDSDTKWRSALVAGKDASSPTIAAPTSSMTTAPAIETLRSDRLARQTALGEESTVALQEQSATETEALVARAARATFEPARGVTPKNSNIEARDFDSKTEGNASPPKQPVTGEALGLGRVVAQDWRKRQPAPPSLKTIAPRKINEKPFSAPIRPDKQEESLAKGGLVQSSLDGNLSHVLQDVALEAGVTIVADPEIQGQISADFSNKGVPVEEALDTVLADSGYSWTKTPHYYLVSSADLEARSFGAETEARRVKLAYISGQAAVASLNPSYARYVKADPERRAVTVTAPESLAERIEKDIQALDKRPRQVILDARLVAIEKEDLSKLDVEWGWPSVNAGMFGNGQQREQDQEGTQIGYVPDGLTSEALTLQLNMLVENEEAKVIANPQVIAQDGRSAEVRAVREEYYMMSDLSQTGGLAFSSRPELEKVESGTVLEFTPYISDSNDIVLVVATDSGDSVEQGRETDQPIVTRQTTRNEVVVKDGGTMVIRGFQASDAQEGGKKSTTSGKIPLLGKLFKKVDHDPETQEVVAFITPRLIPEQSQLNAYVQEASIQQQAIVKANTSANEALENLKANSQFQAELLESLKQPSVNGQVSIPEVNIESPKESPQVVAQAPIQESLDAPVSPPATPSKPMVEEADSTELPPSSRFKAVPVNPWVMTAKDAQSTFGLDVDTASYTLCRRYIRSGYLPPVGAVRMEEFINYFDDGYSQQNEPTFAVHAMAGPSPFARTGENLTLLKIGVKARTVGRDQRKAAHLVFVVDASASMGQPDRLPLVQHGLSLLVGQLAEVDRVSLVTCSQDARLHLEAVSAQESEKIYTAIDAIQPAGSTNLLAGLELAYATARRYFVAGCLNHVILCSDGVANVGQTEADAVLAAVAADRQQGITMTSVGVGYGAFNDTLLEGLANKGDGSYVFLDSAEQARRVFVDQFAATLHTVAKDARIQVEFNPQRVRRYRLIGYENRDIADRDFRNDTIDAGEVGSGQCATALYELELIDAVTGNSDTNIGTVYVRYRDLETNRIEEISRLLNTSLVQKRTIKKAPRFFLAAATARFAEWLRQSEHVRGTQLKDVLGTVEQVQDTLSLDRDIKELADLIRQAEHLPRAP